MVFWKIVEWIVRLFYWKRFSLAKQIGKAGLKLVNETPQAALAHLETIDTEKLHESLLSLYHYTKGRILDALHRTDEAEASFETVISKDPKHDRARLELAIILGRKFQFSRCRALLAELKKTTDEDTITEVDRILDLLSKTIDGRRRNEFKARAEATINTFGVRQETGALVISKLGAWIEADPDKARKDLDDIALSIGESLIRDSKGQIDWKISLGMDESLVERADGKTLNPFVVTNQFIESKIESPEGQAPPLQTIVEQSWD